MLVEICVGRQKRVERVAGAESAAETERASAVLLLVRVPRATVHAQTRRERAVLQHVPPERLAHRKRRHLHVIERIGHGEPVEARHLLAPGRVPATAAETLEELVDAVESPAFRRADHEQMRRTRHEPKAIRTEVA